ncbi:uncharacterized protein LOC115921513 [Strongylocentrotus purpuratus]|uniref:Uncharacterized protein n=1 Tax=Strongylocentrotus purpuratus TaxID=7668 RepID=A0A7M7NDH3_STRPU|nr:uncharacterized protein LOC115921513 [Strongylocentrotus purpuratus]
MRCHQSSDHQQHSSHYHLIHPTNTRIKMASKVLIAFMALLVVAMAMEFAEEGMDFDMEQLHLSEKRGQSMRKYKVCETQFSADQTCWCSRRNGKFAFCAGAAGGENI